MTKKTQDPKLAITALTEPNDKQIAPGVTVKKMTLTRYAWLELLDSPFVNPDKKFTLAEVIPSVYVCCLENTELLDLDPANLKEIKKEAFAWADRELIGIESVGKAVKVITDGLVAINSAAPNASASKKAEA